MESFHRAFEAAARGDYAAAQTLQHQCCYSLAVFAERFDLYLSQLPESTDGRVFCSALLSGFFDDHALAYAFSVYHEPSILHAVHVVVNSNSPEVCRLIRKACCRRRTLLRAVYTAVSDLPQNRAYITLLGEIAQDCISSPAVCEEIVVAATQFDECSLAILSAPRLEKSVRDAIWRRLTENSLPQLVFECCKLSLPPEGIKHVGRLCYLHFWHGNEGAALALQRLVYCNGPVNFIPVQGEDFDYLLLHLASGILTLPDAVCDSFAEFLGDLFSYCNISYTSNFVDSDVIDGVRKLEMHAETLINVFCASQKIRRSDQLVSLFGAVLQTYYMMRKLDYVAMLYQLIQIIEQKEYKLDFCAVMLVPDNFQLTTESADLLFNYIISAFPLSQSLEDIFMLGEAIDKIYYDFNDEYIRLSVTPAALETLYLALYAVLNFMAERKVKYYESNPGSRFQAMLFRFLDANYEAAKSVVMQFSNTHCMIPQLLLFLGIQPATVFYMLHYQLLCAYFDYFAVQAAYMMGTDLLDICSIIGEFKAYILTAAESNPRVQQFIVGLIDGYIRCAVDKQIVDFLMYAIGANFEFASRFLDNPALVYFVLSTLYVYCSSFKLFKAIVARYPQDALAYLRELCANELFDVKTNIISLADIIDVLVVYAERTQISVQQLIYQLFDAFPGLPEQLVQASAYWTGNTLRPLIRQMLETAKSALLR